MAAEKTMTMTWSIVDESAVLAAFAKLCSVSDAEIVPCETVEEMAKELVLNFDLYGINFGMTSFHDLGLEY